MNQEENRWGQLQGQSLTKGQGTGNDFIFLTDPKVEISLDADLIARVCDRHFGFGADGFIRAAHTAQIDADLARANRDALWFMDYRNADGSISEMCGNGVRAFVEYLVTEKMVTLEVGHTIKIGTRAGVKTVARTEHGYAIDMGPWSFIDGDSARENNSDSRVTAEGLRTPRVGLSISMGNPHTVVALAEDEKLEGLSLTKAPKVTPKPINGTNVEFVVPEEIQDTQLETGEKHVGAIHMRVYERGVGETQSCGTGACAAAAATRFWGGETAPDEWLVHVPGGTLAVTFVMGPDNLEHVVLSGPAQMTGKFTLL